MGSWEMGMSFFGAVSVRNRLEVSVDLGPSSAWLLGVRFAGMEGAAAANARSELGRYIGQQDDYRSRPKVDRTYK